MEYQIRPIEFADARGINALRRMPGVMENILGIPSEPIKKNEEFLSKLDPNSHQFVAVIKQIDGSDLVIGTAGLHVSPNPRNRHTATVGIMVHKDYQEMGVGSALMKAVLDVADNWLMLVRVELSVFADNERAIHVYEKLGFEKEGIARKAAIRNGEYADEYIMARIRNI
ncbi:MAG: GNAT family N-acetyltransferase [Anaerofustis sp.]